MWLLYHKVEGDNYVETRPEDEVDDEQGNEDWPTDASDATPAPPSVTSNAYKKYVADLIHCLWAYRAKRFVGQDHLFDGHQTPKYPPVFVKDRAHWNVLANPTASPAETGRVWAAISPEKRHRWFRSMKSSQALAQSVFANLKEYGKLGLLAEIVDDDGEPVFRPQDGQNCQIELEYEIDYLHERRRTSVDAFFKGPYRIAVECKLSEASVGACSRPTLKPDTPTYDLEFCDGSYTRQLGRAERCSLTTIGASYWDAIPKLFAWARDEDRTPCPLRCTYQLVRNVLVACVRARVKVTS